MKSRGNPYLTFAITCVGLLLCTMFIPVAQAAQTDNSNMRSGRQVSLSEIISAYDETYDYDAQMNIANMTDSIYSNFNMTIQPFLENNSMEGIVVAPYFVPLLFQKNLTSTSMSLGYFFNLLPETIIDGSSDCWIRIPVSGLPDMTDIRLRIARVIDPLNFNVSIDTYGSPSFSNPAVVQKVYDLSYDPHGDNGAARTNYTITGAYDNQLLHHSERVAPTSWHWYEWTYFHASFPMFPNEWYYAEWDLDLPNGTTQANIAFAQDDFAADSKLNSWFNVNGVASYFPCDLDTTMIITSGMSNGVSGIGTLNDMYINDTYPSSFVIDSYVPFNKDLSHDYFNLAMPYYLNLSYSATVNYTTMLILFDANGNEVINFTQRWNCSNATTFDSLIQDFDMSSVVPFHCEYYRLIFEVNLTGDRNMETWLHLWGSQKYSTWNAMPGYSNLYVQYNNSKTFYTQPMEYLAFIPYGYFGESDSRWVNTDHRIVVIPETTPDTLSGIRVSINRFVATVAANNIINQIVSFTLGGFIKAILDFYVQYILTPLYNFFLKPIVDAIIAGLNSFGQFLAGIGAFIWDILNIVLDALEWFAYWAVRFIYSISLVMVYLINVFGIISLNTALMGYARTGNGKDFIRTFKSGWKFVFGIITLLIGILLMAISIVGAVVPL